MTPVAGSSPLARGTGGVAVPDAPARRFIPAGAGNSRDKPCVERMLTVHPRWRGEQRRSSAAQRYAPGSSPLARGTGLDCGLPHQFVRFIPAGAGNRPINRVSHAPPSVHPRWRGEQRQFVAFWHVRAGSSPLARGTGVGGGFGVSGVRFIPAGAGNRQH